MLGRRLLWVIVATSAFIASAAVADAAFSGANGRIAFTTNRDGNSEVYVMRPSGAGLTNLTNDPTDDGSPAWSRDGGQLAFRSRPADAESQIYRMNADGSGRTRVTTVDAWFHDNPAWSPDGTQLAFDANLDLTAGSVFDVLTINVDGTGLTNLTPDNSAPDVQPAWSPDGSRIAFASLRGDPGSDWEIYVMDADGTNVSPVTSAPGDETHPSWSPDGRRIAFAREVCTPGCVSRIHVIDADGTDELALTSGTPADRTPAWSPDGSKIAFERFHAGPNSEIYTMSFDGTNQTNVTAHPAADTLPDWEPLAFTGYPRPKSASPLRASLVVAYRQCTSGDLTHAPPLAYPSCSDPTQASAHLTVGTADANSAPANFVGFVRYATLAGAPGEPEDSDVTLAARLEDVRCAGGAADSHPCGPANAEAGADYVGELAVRVSLRLTDRLNGATGDGGTDPATVTTTELSAPVQCATTDGTRGGDCVLSTSANALVPGLVRDTKRALWELGRVQVFDGGPDGDVDTHAGDSLFAVQGVFVP